MFNNTLTRVADVRDGRWEVPARDHGTGARSSTAAQPDAFAQRPCAGSAAFWQSRPPGRDCRWPVTSLHAGDAPVVITNVTVLAGDSSRAAGRIRGRHRRTIQAIDAWPRPLQSRRRGRRRPRRLSRCPGFIDMHAHLMVPRCAPGPDGTAFDRAVSERMLSVLLDFGITSVRSPATPTIAGLHLRDDLNAGRVLGPRAQASAELIDDASLSREALRRLVKVWSPSIRTISRSIPGSVRTPLRPSSRRRTRMGCLSSATWDRRPGWKARGPGIDFLTHAADWSAGTLPLERREQYADAIARRGALRARIDWLELLDLQAREVHDTIAEVARRDISIDPTLIAYDTKFAGPQGGSYRDDPFADVVPEMLQDWKTCSHLTDDWTADDYRRWKAGVPDACTRSCAHSVREVSRLTTGTDVTNPWVIPGQSLHQEFELLVHAGFTPRDVLQMTWTNAAAHFAGRTWASFSRAAGRTWFCCAAIRWRISGTRAR